MKRINVVLVAAVLSLGGLSACAQPPEHQASDKEEKVEDSVMALAEKAAQAAEEAANRADAESPARPDRARADGGKTYPPPAKAAPMPWPTMRRRIEALIASVRHPEDTHPERVEGVLGVGLSQTSDTHWSAEGAFTEGWEYSISVADSGTEEYAAGHDIYIYLMPPKEFVDHAVTSPKTICTWPMDGFSKVLLQNGYVKGVERNLANEVWDFYDLTSDKTYNRYMDGFVYRMKDGSEQGAPCLSRIHISTGYKEEER
jgi:hypothetical protein